MKRKLKLVILISACVIAYSQERPNPNFTGGDLTVRHKENSEAKPRALLFRARRPY